MMIFIVVRVNDNGDNDNDNNQRIFGVKKDEKWRVMRILNMHTLTQCDGCALAFRMYKHKNHKVATRISVVVFCTNVWSWKNNLLIFELIISKVQFLTPIITAYTQMPKHIREIAIFPLLLPHDLYTLYQPECSRFACTLTHTHHNCVHWKIGSYGVYLPLSDCVAHFSSLNSNVDDVTIWKWSGWVAESMATATPSQWK